MKSSWIGIGFSHHSVPSLSNTATRSSTGTAFDTVRSTNSTSASLAGPSLQLASDPDMRRALLLHVGSGPKTNLNPIYLRATPNHPDGVRGRIPTDDYVNTLTARAMTRPRMPSEASDWTPIAIFVQGTSGTTISRSSRLACSALTAHGMSM